jgi:DNA-binding MarR family transcriptional regulator
VDNTSQDDALIGILQRTAVALVRSDRPDLTARQLAAFLLVHTTPGPHTIRGLARALNIPKPSVTRAVDRLEEFGLAQRKPDRTDRRSVIVEETPGGGALLRDVRLALAEAANGVTSAEVQTEEGRDEPGAAPRAHAA